MTDTLIIIPTKNRPEYLNTLIQNLITQEGDFDIYIADMCDDPKLLYGNWLLGSGLERLRILGHRYMVETVHGSNQCDAYNAGVRYAINHGYTYCMGSDDDIIFEPKWIVKGRQNMVDDPNLGICAGITLDPRLTIEYQTIGIGVPPETEHHPDFEGTLVKGDYYHCIYVPLTPEPKYYEVVYGMCFFRPEDIVKVGGFPAFLSPLGFRGEMYPQSAIFLSGKKLMVDPTMVSWHYQAPYGGLRFDEKTKAKYLAHDFEIWKKWISKRIPRVELL